MSENISLLDVANSPYANIKNLGDAIEVAVRITDQMKIKHKWDNAEEIVSMPTNPDEDNTYCTFAGTTSFNYEGKKYELPYSEHIEKVLDDAGFNQDFEGHTFASNGWYPVDKKDYWERLETINNVMDQMRRIEENKKAKEEFKDYCNRKGIKPLDEKYRDRCFKVPDDGYKIIQEDGNERWDLKPGIFNKTNTEARVDYVGKYSKHVGGGGYSGAYTFIDTDGSAYTTRSEEVMNHLKANGFTESEKVQLIALGWNEKFKDSVIQEKYTETVMDDKQYNEKKANEEIERKNYATEALKETRNELARIKAESQKQEIENKKLKELLQQYGIDPNMQEVKQEGPKLDM